MIMAILALSLALIWGYGSILCFGQSAFFGLGAYTYAIAMFNIGDSTLPVLLAIALPAGFAGLLGYFMFYGRISDVYLGVITLTVTLILFNSVNSTAGPEFHIGVARLGGFNGIPGIPPLNIPGNRKAVIDLEGMFYLAAFSLLATYFGLRLLLASRFGRIIVGIRENERRAELLGYDPRAYKLATFIIGGALAGFAGCLFANWGNFVSPTIFGLAQSAQIIIWVIVGGRGTLIGPNGAGKSTFFKMLTGQLEPTHGRVLFRGEDISHAHAHDIARLGIGIKTQVPSVFDGLSVRENIWLAASRIHSGEKARRAVEEMLERVGLTDVAERLVG